MKIGQKLLYLFLFLIAVIGGRYLFVKMATEQVADATGRMTERIMAQSQALQAETAARLAEHERLDAVRRRYQSVVGCANKAEGNRCTCFDANAQQVPDIPAELCLKVMEGGLNWLRRAADQVSNPQQ